MADTTPKPPDAASLHEAALAHLARYATSRAGLLRVLERRIARYLRAGGDEALATPAKAAAREVVDRLAAAGAVDDAAFAAMRARSLTRAGRSRRAVIAHLRTRGVDGEVADAALPEDPEADFAAAIAYTRKRRIGAFRTAEADAAGRMKELAAMARAGFQQETARRALATDRDSAEEVLTRLRQS
jgi:regulatory protein